MHLQPQSTQAQLVLFCGTHLEVGQALQVIVGQSLGGL